MDQCTATPSSSGHDLPRWTTPLDLFERDRRQHRRNGLLSGIRILAIVVAVEFALYLFFIPHLPLPPADRSRLQYGILIVNLYAIVPFLAAFQFPSTPPEFRLAPDGIHISSHHPRLLPYDSIVSFSLSEEQPSTRLKLHLKKGITRSISLPADLAPQIIAIISQHLPQKPPPPEHAPLRHRDFIISLAVTAIYIFVVGLLLRRFVHYLSREWGQIVLEVAFFFFGPGTITAFLLLRRRATQQLFALATWLNIAGGMATLIYAALPKILSTLR